MFNPFKIFSKRTLNTPPTTPPTTPEAEEVEIQEEGIYLTQYSFNIKWKIIEERMKTTNIILVGTVLVLFICFLTLFYGYWQFTSVSLSDYSQKVKDLNDQKFQFQQTEIDLLLKTSTTSGK